MRAAWAFVRANERHVSHRQRKSGMTDIMPLKEGRAKVIAHSAPALKGQFRTMTEYPWGIQAHRDTFTKRLLELSIGTRQRLLKLRDM